MTQNKIARLTGSLLARKGEAKPAASVIDFNVSGMFNRPVEVASGTPATHPVAAPDTARPAAGTLFPGACDTSTRTIDPDRLPDPDALLRQLTKHQDYQPLDSIGAPRAGEAPGDDGPVVRPSKRHALTVRLDPDRYRRFKMMARIGGRTNQEILLDALNKYLDAPTGAGKPGWADTEHAQHARDQNQLGDDAVAAIAVELGVIRALVERLLADEPLCPTV